VLTIPFVDEFGDSHDVLFGSLSMKSKWPKPGFIERASPDFEPSRLNGGDFFARAILAQRYSARRPPSGTP
jgi:hypothetical protein